MSDVITRNTPTTYEPVRIALQQNDDGEIVALADFRIRNANGQVIDDDHPTVTLTEQERATFLTWFLGKLDLYEAATGLERYVPPERGE